MTSDHRGSPGRLIPILWPDDSLGGWLGAAPVEAICRERNPRRPVSRSPCADDRASACAVRGLLVPHSCHPRANWPT
jgi:hypothetical protein